MRVEEGLRGHAGAPSGKDRHTGPPGPAEAWGRPLPTSPFLAHPATVPAALALIILALLGTATGANRGLPWEQTYDLSVQLADGSNLAPGADVQVGGFRVGRVDRIAVTAARVNGLPRPAARVAVNLDRSLEPLSADSVFRVRERNAMGAKYVELQPGSGPLRVPPGGTVPLVNDAIPAERDDVFNTFDGRTRASLRELTQGVGIGVAGRGTGLNRSLEVLPDLARRLQVVTAELSSPRTGLAETLQEARVLSAELRPVASVLPNLLSSGADTLAAVTRRPAALRQSVSALPPAFEAGTRASDPIRRTVTNADDLGRRLRPGVATLSASLRPVTRALETAGRPLAAAPGAAARLEGAARAADGLLADPQTLLALQEGRSAVAVGGPLIRHLTPYQTVCNYWNYMWTGFGDSQSQEVRDGTVFRSLAKTPDLSQDNTLGTSKADRPADVPTGTDPSTAFAPSGRPEEALHAQAYSPAVDDQGNADCQTGQTGYPDGPLVSRSRYGPREDGGQHVVLDGNTPGLAGNTTGPANGGGRRGKIPLPRNLEDLR